MTPASMTIVVSPHETAIMFIPNSPRPPRGTTSSVADDTSGTADWFMRCPAIGKLVIVTRNRNGRPGRQKLRESGRWEGLKTRWAQRLPGKTIAQLATAPRTQPASVAQGAFGGQPPLAQALEPARGRR